MFSWPEFRSDFLIDGKGTPTTESQRTFHSVGLPEPKTLFGRKIPDFDFNITCLEKAEFLDAQYRMDVSIYARQT